MQFLQARDAEQNLKVSVQKFEEEFVFCEHVNEDELGMYIRYKSLSDYRNPASRFKKFYLNKTKVLPIQVELGWTNLHNFSNATYLERIPVRGTNTGLNSSNITTWSPNGDRWSFNNIITDPGFEESLKKSYPRFETMHGKMQSFALHPRIALFRATLDVYSVYYNKELVGEYSANKKVLTLYSCHRYLKEFIQKIIKEPVDVWETA